jgi:hypothetical protein
MTERERLIELLQSVPVDCTGCRGVDTIAEYLIQNGVTIKACETCEYIRIHKMCGTGIELIGKSLKYCPECGKKIK